MHLCASCRRHVKASPCPFCGEQRSLPTLGAPSGRLSRAQLVAGAALVVTAATVAACGSGNSAQPDPGVPAAVYGAPAAPEQGDAGADPQSATPPVPQPPTAPVAMYGAPPS